MSDLVVIHNRHHSHGGWSSSIALSAIGEFTLAYEDEVTWGISYNASASEIALAVGNLSALRYAEITAEAVNCTAQEISCAWRVTFVGVHGDASILSPHYDDLGGNGATITVEELIPGQNTSDVIGSPVTVGNSSCK